MSLEQNQTLTVDLKTANVQNNLIPDDLAHLPEKIADICEGCSALKEKNCTSIELKEENCISVELRNIAYTLRFDIKKILRTLECVTSSKDLDILKDYSSSKEPYDKPNSLNPYQRISALYKDGQFPEMRNKLETCSTEIDVQLRNIQQ